MKRFLIPESVVVEKAKEIFLGQGLRVALEVPFLERSIDLVYMDQRKNLVAIEFKWANWKQALLQARSHLYGATKVYICIPKPRNLSEKLLNEIKPTPIGLLLFSFDTETNHLIIETSIKAKKSTKKWRPGEKWLRDAFKQREQGGKNVIRYKNWNAR